MSVKIGHAVGDENNKARGGFAGDQTGREVRIQDWYKRDGGWEVCLVPTDRELGERAAAAMTAICENDKIGYDQDQRWTARAAIQIAGSIEGAMESEIDCSSGMDIAYEQAGLAIERGYTGNLERRYMATGKFKAYRDSAHLESADYAVAGTMYLTAGAHVAMVLEDGPLAGLSALATAESAKRSTGTTIPRIRQAAGVEAPYVVAIKNVRIRTGPAKTYPSLGYIKKGTMVAYGDTDPDNGWHAVETTAGSGFVSGDESFTKLVI